MNKECQLIQELFPLYQEELVSPEITEYISNHLAQCPYCKETWEQLNQPLEEILTDKDLEKEKGEAEKFLVKIKKTVLIAISIFLLGGLGIAYASFSVGKHVSLDDPSYRMVDQLGLFTQINQAKSLDNSEVTLEKGIFDNSRTLLFLKVTNPEEQFLETRLTDKEGNEYLHRGSQVLQNKYYVVEFDPLSSSMEEARVVLNYSDSSEQIEFLFPVDITETLQHTRIVYPNVEQNISNVNIALKKAVLGVSQSEFKIKIDWPYDGSVSGIAVGRDAYFPTSFSKLSEKAAPPPGPVAPGGLISNYAASYGVNYRSEDLPDNRPALYDLTQRQEVTIQQGEYKTTQFPCQVEGYLKFDIVELQTKELELLLPPIYTFQKINRAPQINLDFSQQQEEILDESMPFDKGIIEIKQVRLEKERLFIKYEVKTNRRPGELIPNFLLEDEKGQKQGNMHFSYNDQGEVFFSLFNKENRKYTLILDSIGQLLPRQKFSINISDE